MPANYYPANVAPSGFPAGLTTGTQVAKDVIGTWDTHKKAEQDLVTGGQQQEINSQIIQESDLKLADAQRKEIEAQKLDAYLNSSATDMANKMTEATDPQSRGYVDIATKRAVELNLPINPDGSIDRNRLTIRDIQNVGKYLETHPEEAAVAMKPHFDILVNKHNEIEKHVQSLQEKLTELDKPKKGAKPMLGTEKAESAKKLQDEIATYQSELDNLKSQRDETAGVLNSISKTHAAQQQYAAIKKGSSYAAMDATDKGILERGEAAGENPSVPLKVINDRRLADQKQLADYQKEIDKIKLKNSNKGGSKEYKPSVYKEQLDNAKQSLLEKGYVDVTKEQIAKEAASLKKGDTGLPGLPSNAPDNAVISKGRIIVPDKRSNTGWAYWTSPMVVEDTTANWFKGKLGMEQTKVPEPIIGESINTNWRQ